jgi:hypothetical protein
MKKLSDYSYNKFSQFGEDGIIQKIFEIIGVTSRCCVEFGAWDGYHLSNTANLWTKGWKGILIEADSYKYENLLHNLTHYDCYCINAFVGHKDDNTIEAILTKHSINGNSIDFLSIDVDGDDYYIFQSLNLLRPRVISCEYNPTIPVHTELIAEPGSYFGCSSLSLCKLAETKGYRLVSITDTNCIFVTEKEFVNFSEFETSLEKLAINKHLTYLMTGYDGSYALSQKPTYGFRHPCLHNFVGEYFVPKPSTNARHSPYNIIMKKIKKNIKKTKKKINRLFTK